MQVLVVIARIIHRSTLYFAVARNLVYENTTWEKKTWQVENVKYIQKKMWKTHDYTI